MVLANSAAALQWIQTGNAYVVGEMQWGNFATTPDAFQSTHTAGNARNIFVSKVKSDGSGLICSTYFDGGSGN